MAENGVQSAPEETLLFYRYSQCNVMGCYIGPQIVLVEASSPEEAEALAVGAGLYFDGVAAGRDCECCGDRWTRYADEFPTREEAVASVEDWRQPEDDAPVYQVVHRSV